MKGKYYRCYPYFFEAAELGHIPAILRICLMASDQQTNLTLPTAQSAVWDLQIRWYEVSPEFTLDEINTPDSKFTMACFHHYRGNIREKDRFLTEASEKGHVVALYELGKEISKPKAILEKSSDLGFSRASLELAIQLEKKPYRDRDERNQNLSLAFQYYQLAEGDWPQAQSSIGLMYCNGIGVVQKNISMGMKYLKLADQNGCKDGEKYWTMAKFSPKGSEETLIYWKLFLETLRNQSGGASGTNSNQQITNFKFGVLENDIVHSVSAGRLQELRPVWLKDEVHPYLVAALFRFFPRLQRPFFLAP